MNSIKFLRITIWKSEINFIERFYLFEKITYFHHVKIWMFTLFLLLGSCTLNADQEVSLNNALTSYINSRNNGAVMSYVAYTHPKVVSHYKNEGDSAFQSRFDVSNEYTRPFFQDGLIRTTQKNNNTIHVKYQFKKIEDYDYDMHVSEAAVIAISEDEGQNWFFTDEDDYFNTTIFKNNERLISKE